MEYLKKNGDPDKNKFLRLLDYFYLNVFLLIQINIKGDLFLISELLYENLFEGIIKKKMILSDAKIRNISRDILIGLKFLKGMNNLDCGIVHCDLKPENIMYTNRDKKSVKIIDFGSAGFVNEEPIDYLQTRPYR